MHTYTDSKQGPHKCDGCTTTISCWLTENGLELADTMDDWKQSRLCSLGTKRKKKGIQKRNAHFGFPLQNVFKLFPLRALMNRIQIWWRGPYGNRLWSIGAVTQILAASKPYCWAVHGQHKAQDEDKAWQPAQMKRKLWPRCHLKIKQHKLEQIGTSKKKKEANMKWLLWILHSTPLKRDKPIRPKQTVAREY